MKTREHKYRAFYDGMMVYDAARVGNTLYWDNGRCFDLFAFKQKHPAILMQYIGFEGKLGKDIYEMDILKDDHGRFLLVEWWKGCFTFKAITETNFTRARNIAEWFEHVTVLPEIIGNIHENPELLKGDES